MIFIGGHEILSEIYWQLESVPDNEITGENSTPA